MRIFTTRKLPFLIAVLLVIGIPRKGSAQNMSLRTNLLYDATLSPNLGFEMPLDSVSSLGLAVGLNAWDIDKESNKKWRHLLLAFDARKYFGQKHVTFSQGRDTLSFHPRYFEANIIYSHFNVGNTRIPFGLYDAVKDRRLQGDLLALGGKYGYSWILARDWRVEAEAGIAIGYAWFKEFDCDHCGTYYGRGDRIFLLPQLGINIVYIIN